METGIGVAVNTCTGRVIGGVRRRIERMRPVIGASNPVVVTIGAKAGGAGKTYKNPGSMSRDF